MDPISSDLEFFDFKDASDEEIKEIQAILKGPGSNGCVELPWEIELNENCVEAFPEIKESVEENDPPASPKSSKTQGPVVSHALHFVAAQAPLSQPVAQLPPQGVEAFVTLPTTVGPYPSAPYIVSRTIPYLRAYPHMGVPLFACPLPATGEAGPYGQFVPVVPTGHEKFVGQIENESNQKNRTAEKQFHRRKKKQSSTDYSLEMDSVDPYRETVDELAQTSPVSSIVSSERPTSMPLVPLPPSSFAVAGGALPIHSYPPGIHTLPYTQMSGPQAPSPAMYYVPVFNHPYGGYISSPPTAPMVLPVNLRPEAEVNELAVNKCSKNIGISDDSAAEEVAESADSANAALGQSCESDISVQSDSESSPVKPRSESVDVPSVAKSTCSEREVTDSSSDPLSKSISSSPDCIPKASAAEDYFTSQPPIEEIKEVLDPSRCWADLFKKPCSEVNGLDCQLPTEHRHKNSSTLKKDIANGKVYSVPASDRIH